jgi:hypothetical protein
MSDQVSAVRARVEQALGAAIRCPYCGIEGCACDHRWGESCRCLASQPRFKYAKELTDAIWPIMESALRAVPLSAETEGLRDEELSRLRELMAKATPGPWARGILEEGCIAGQGGAGKVVVRDTNHGSMPNKADSDLIIAMRNALPRLLAAPTVAQAPQRKPDVFDEIEENR